MRFGFDGSTSILLGSDSAFASEHSVNVSVFGSTRHLIDLLFAKPDQRALWICCTEYTLASSLEGS
jgi:hypothetical protein